MQDSAVQNNSQSNTADSAPHRILIIRLSSIGDIVLASPLIRALREKFPRSSIDFFVRREYRELVEFNPHINRIWLFDTSRGVRELWRFRRIIHQQNYDVILDIHKNLRSLALTTGLRRTAVYRVCKDQWLRFLLVYLKKDRYQEKYGRIPSVAERYLWTARPLGVSDKKLQLEFYIPSEVQEKLKPLYSSLKEHRYWVAVAPGSRHFTKTWPAENFARFIQKLYRSTGVRTVLLGSRDEISTAGRIEAMMPGGVVKNLVGQLDLLETAEIIRHMRVFVSNDSGLMHLAAALQIPQVVIWGSTVQQFGFYPLNPRVIHLENPNLKCRPCHHIGRPACPKKHFLCMTAITPAQVYGAVHKLLVE